MARTERLTKRAVDAAKAEAAAYRVWDADLKGFGLKVSPRGVKTFFVRYRAGGGRTGVLREFTIGRYGVLTPEQARGQAEKLLGGVRLGDDPQAGRIKARTELTVAQLCELYLAEGVATKKGATIYNDRSRINAHVVPLLGRRPVSSVTTADVERFMRDVAAGKTAKTAKRGPRALSVVTGGKGAASRTVGLLGAVFKFAVRRGLRTDNPVAGVQRFKDNKCERFLTFEELSRLGAALREAEAAGLNPKGLAVIRLLVFTGARKSEVEALRWAEVDAERSCLRLGDSKTGAKVVPVGAAALEVLQGIERTASPFVFPADGDPMGSPKHYVGTSKVWAVVRRSAALTDVRLHDLRHTFASLGAGSGQSLPIIGKILGHADVKTTARYAHLADDPVKAAVDRISDAAAAALAGGSAEVLPLRKRR